MPCGVGWISLLCSSRIADFPARFFFTQFNESFALPVADEFWDSLFANAKHWGLINYQLDWMFTLLTGDEDVMKGDEG